MSPSITVVLFEDTDKTRSEILSALTNYLKPSGRAIAFEGSQVADTDPAKPRMYEDRIKSILTSARYDGATLVVADRDLAKSRNFGGLSVNVVTAVARTLAIPICEYARQPDSGDSEWGRRWEEGHIVLDFRDEDTLARRAALAARGFASIGAQLPQVREDEANSSPATTLAALLGKPEYSGKIALYGVREKRLSDVSAKAPQTEQQKQRRMRSFLGYWLWNSLLRYPGLFVNEVAAASYLNIETADFRKPGVQGVFKKALYRGPFADSKQPQWWRGMLDDIVSRKNCADGLELVRKKLSPKIKRSRCCVDPSMSAGYYCIISRKPVSLANSKGGLDWFPRGADLTRISSPMLEEYGPWLDS